MRLRFLILLSMLFAHTISAQLAITPGAHFSVSGNMQLTLQNTDLVNNGTFTTGNGRISFTGNVSSTISGSSPIQFFDLESNKKTGKITSFLN